PRFTLDDVQRLADELVPGEARLTLTRVWRASLSGAHLAVETPESHTAPHRGLDDLVELLGRATLPDAARDFAVGVLRRIAEAEGRVHGCAPEEVHFHEVGAVDSLVDAAGAGLAVARLGVAVAHIAPPQVGSGTVHCAHGEMPVPAPATAELLRGHPLRTGGSGERCTPTGAAILVELAERGGGRIGHGPDPGAGSTTVRAIGYGAGTRDPETGPPNLLRVMLADAAADGGASDAAGTAVDELAVNLDDMTPEEVGALVRAMRERGALEVWTTPAQMKKDRPACVLHALVRPDARDAVVAELFALSSTFGVRWQRVERAEAGRSFDEVSVEGRTVRIKVRRVPGTDAPRPDVDAFPEHDDVEALAQALGVPLRVARARALDAWRAGRPGGARG
ncbi:MAG: LarC family nickel insertion protein, partial [Planctomycetota bacterium]